MDICKKYVDLHDKIKHIKIAMLTIADERGFLRSRPMVTIKTECEGSIWFFTNFDSDKVEEIKINPMVNLCYADQDEETYVSISGKAEVVRDKGKMKELWKSTLQEWIPDGLDNNDLALLKIGMEYAEYWDGKEMVQIWDTTYETKA